MSLLKSLLHISYITSERNLTSWSSRDKVPAAVLASAYCGNNQYGSALFTQTALAYTCLSPSINKLARNILNEEDAIIFLKNLLLNRVGVDVVKKLAMLNDYCPSYSFIHLSYLNPKMIFTRGWKGYSAATQFNTINQCKRYFQTSVFRAVQHGTVTKTLKKCCLALKKEKLVLQYIEKWSQTFEMHTLHAILPPATVMDAKLCENWGNKNNAMQSILILMNDISLDTLMV